MDDCPMCRAKDEDLARTREDNMSLRDACDSKEELIRFANQRGDAWKDAADKQRDRANKLEWRG